MALAGTAVAENLLGFVIVALLGAVFIWSATVEERNLTEAFPEEYPAYQASSKMLIPFIF